MTRAERANSILVHLFHVGFPPPTRRELIEAYPFGVRKHWPYKVWCRQVRMWKSAHAQGLSRPPDLPRRRRSPTVHDPRQQELPLYARVD